MGNAYDELSKLEKEVDHSIYKDAILDNYRKIIKMQPPDQWPPPEPTPPIRPPIRRKIWKVTV